MHEVKNTNMYKCLCAERKTNETVCALWVLEDSYPPSFLIGVIVSELVSYCAACKVLKARWQSPVDTEVTQEARVCYRNIGRWIHCGEKYVNEQWLD